MQENIKSYNSIYQLREAFRRSGGHSDTFADEFNRLETPARLYFRIFFHFNTGHGLLNTGYQFIDPDPERVAYTEDTNTAISYLFTNGEHQRRQMLDDFVSLLSNINTYSPWYFQSIEGLQEALQRSEYTGEFKIDEEPRSITIKTLEDAYDNRISTLLDLYKAVAFSKIQHKEILPANLRRFDMSIYIINTPLAYVHYGYGSKFDKDEAGLNGLPARPLPERSSKDTTFEIPSYREWADGSSEIYSSAKLIELQGCEIDANSAASAYTEVKSDEPFGMAHEIKITFQDIIEQRYNDTLNRIIGDYIFMDMDRADRESKDNIWGSGVPGIYSDSQLATMSIDRNIQDNINNLEFGDIREPIWHWYDDNDPNNIEGDDEYGWYEEPNPPEITSKGDVSMDETVENLVRERDESIGRYESETSGRIIGASSIMDKSEHDRDNADKISQKYGVDQLFLNLSKDKNTPILDNAGQDITDKYNPGIIGGMAQDFLRGAVGAAKSYVGSAIAKITMGNLYWGSLSNPQATLNMGKLGSNLMQRGLDETIGKNMRRGLGSVKSALNDAKAAARGWVSGSSIGSNMSGSGNSANHRP